MTDHYPVKRRGAPRRLNPNTDGAAWLEEEAWDDTEIYTEEVFEDDGIKYTRAYGWQLKSNPRPMFQIIPPVAFSGMRPSVTPCQCDRFDQSWACELHPQIAWDPERRRWKRPCTGDRMRCECDPCHERRQRAADRSNGYVSDGAYGLRPPQGLIDSYLRQMELYSNVPVEPRLHVRDTDHSYEATVLRDNREMQGAVMTEASREAARTGWPVRGQVLGRWARIHADGRIIFEQTPPERVLAALPDISVTLSGAFTLEIDCETEQGAGPLAIEVEPSDDPTTAH